MAEMMVTKIGKSTKARGKKITKYSVVKASSLEERV
jgi:hypothetical protein